MQRIACSASLFVTMLGLVGCGGQHAAVSLGPPPPPVLSTRAVPIVRPIAPPPRPQAIVSPRHDTIHAADLQVAGGIDRDRWKLVVVHHSAHPKASPESMDRYHRDVRKWSNGLGYHFVIGNGVGFPDGALFVGPRWKKQQTGAHCRSTAGRYLGAWHPDNYFNEHGIGICLIGNFERDQPTPGQWRTLQELVAMLVAELDLDPDAIYGHGEITHRTACPGSNLDMSGVRRAVAARLRESPLATRGPTGFAEGGK